MLQQMNASWPSPAFQNPDVAKLSRDKYGLAELAALHKTLVGKGTLVLRRYASGGASAVTVPGVDEATLSLIADVLTNLNNDPRAVEHMVATVPAELQFKLRSAVGGLLLLGWDRDSVMQSATELVVTLDPELGAGLDIEPEAWRRGLTSCLVQHFKNQFRFLEIITGKSSGVNTGAGPHIRYNPFTLTEVDASWGHRQNDAFGSVLWLLYFALNRGYLSWNEPNLPLLATAYTCLLRKMWSVTRLPDDHDLGAWEDKKAQHASSLLVVVPALRELADFLSKRGVLSYAVENQQYDVGEHDIRGLTSECEAQLAQILPNEFIRGENGEIRSVDAALINGPFLGALSGRPAVSDAMTLTIIANIERDLMGHIAIARYPKDKWDGRRDRFDLGNREEAQWSHVSPMISYVLGEMYRRTGDERYLAHQTYHFNRALACVNERWNIPEAYIVDLHSRQWVSDANEPLAWAQAMVILAFAGMKQSLTHQAALAAAQASASPAPAEGTTLGAGSQ